MTGDSAPAKALSFGHRAREVGKIMRFNFKNFVILSFMTLVAPVCFVLIKNSELIGEVSSAHRQKQFDVVAPVIVTVSCVGTLVVLGLTVATRRIWLLGHPAPSFSILYLVVSAATFGLIGLSASLTGGGHLAGALMVFLLFAGAGFLWGLPVAAGLGWIRR